MFFETVPQILLQVRMFVYFENREEFDVNVNTILFSILFAFMHGMLEFLILGIEAHIFEQSFSEYFVICFNGRLGWVPKMQKLRDPLFVTTLVGNGNLFNYDRIERVICGYNAKVDFLFSNQTAYYLAQMIYKLESSENKKDLPVITVGKSMSEVDF